MPHPRSHGVPGQEPGTLSPRPGASASRIRAIGYGPAELAQVELHDVSPLAAMRRAHPVLWVDVVGLADTGIVAALGDAFGLHPLALEDVMSQAQRPKVEEYDEHLFVVFHVPIPEPAGRVEQVGMFVGDGWIVTCRDSESGAFDPVIIRLEEGRRRLRAGGPDYLAYALLDAAIDCFMPLVDGYAERLDELELRALETPSRGLVRDLHGVGHELSLLQRVVGPLVGVVSALENGEGGQMKASTRLYLRDSRDHVQRLSADIEEHRELARSVVELCMSSLTASTNEVMKVLTIIATIFIPLGVVAGIYGMNFDTGASPWNMPELRWAYGYPFALGLMTVVAASFLLYFRRKGWLGRPRPDKRRPAA